MLTSDIPQKRALSLTIYQPDSSLRGSCDTSKNVHNGAPLPEPVKMNTGHQLGD